MSYAPEVEWRLTAQWIHHTYESFQELDGEQQSENVAAYRVHQQIEGILTQEQIKESRRAARRAKKL